VATADWVDSSPAISGRTIYCGSHDKKLYALEVETGIVLWEYETEGELASSPAISSGRVCIGSNDGNVYCFKGS
jgi:outer membrane protein assembly factor BamB